MPDTRNTTAEAMAALSSNYADLNTKTQNMNEVIQTHDAKLDHICSVLEKLQGSLHTVLVAAARTEKQPLHPSPDPTPILPTPTPLEQTPLTNQTPPTPITTQNTTPPNQIALHRQSTHLTHQTQPYQTTYPQTRLPKIEIPFFSGDGVDGWLFQANRYFDLHRTPPDEKTTIAAFYLTGDALDWYRYMHLTHQIESWSGFERDLVMRFGPSAFWNAEVSINKLQQTSSVTAYISEFESLSTRTPG